MLGVVREGSSIFNTGTLSGDDGGGGGCDKGFKLACTKILSNIFRVTSNAKYLTWYSSYQHNSLE